MRAAVRPVGLRGGLLGPQPVRGRGVPDARARGPPVRSVRRVGARRADRVLLGRDQGAFVPQVPATRDATGRARRDARAQRGGHAQASRSNRIGEAEARCERKQNRRRDAASDGDGDGDGRRERQKRRVLDGHRAGRGPLPGECRLSVRGRVRPRVPHRRLATRGLVREGDEPVRVRGRPRR